MPSAFLQQGTSYEVLFCSLYLQFMPRTHDEGSTMSNAKGSLLLVTIMLRDDTSLWNDRPVNKLVFLLLVHPKQGVGKDHKDQNGTDKVVPQQGQHREDRRDVQERRQGLFQALQRVVCHVQIVLVLLEIRLPREAIAVRTSREGGKKRNILINDGLQKHVVSCTSSRHMQYIIPHAIRIGICQLVEFHCIPT